MQANRQVACLSGWGSRGHGTHGLSCLSWGEHITLVARLGLNVSADNNTRSVFLGRTVIVNHSISVTHSEGEACTFDHAPHRACALRSLAWRHECRGMHAEEQRLSWVQCTSRIDMYCQSAQCLPIPPGVCTHANLLRTHGCLHASNGIVLIDFHIPLMTGPAFT